MTSESVIGSSTQAGSSATSGSMPPPLNVILPTQGEQQRAGGQQTPQTQTPTQLGTTEGTIPNTQVLKRKPSRPPSNSWQHFTRRDDEKAVCNYCGKIYACNSSRNGTSNMNKHLKVCNKNPHRESNKKQKTISLGKGSEDDPNSVNFKLVEFSQELTRLALAKMIVIDELPFKHVENEGFKHFVSVACPRFKVPCRVSVAKDCMLLYNDEKEKLKKILSANNQMVSLTTDCWTSIQNLNYMVITCHYIDERWKLNKKILRFNLISDHKGETIGKNLESCLKDWGIKRVCCVTVDNASANNVALTYLIRGMSDWNGETLLKGEFMQMRCTAHILNLIVSDGLKTIDESISKVRAACKFVKSSSSRLASFRRCVRECNISCKAMIVLDVMTRWNSTYLMLEVAVKYEKAFNRLRHQDSSFRVFLCGEGVDVPMNVDWERARMFVKFLKVFYDATLSFSGSLHVTTNTFFKKMCDIEKSLQKWSNSDDVVLRSMTNNMQLKFSKYWESGAINYLLFVAVVLDPRYKYDYIEFCFSKMYGSDKSKEMMKTLKELVQKLFEYYEMEYPILVSSSSASSSHFTQSNTSQSTAEDEDEADWDEAFSLKMKQKNVDVKKSELERYIGAENEDCKDPSFDILGWWKGKSTKYYVLSRMARDILAIPVSTVSSESAFSTGGRVLDSFRSSLNSNTVEALICAQNWIRKPKSIDLRAHMDEVQQLEEEIEGLRLGTAEVNNGVET